MQKIILTLLIVGLCLKGYSQYDPDALSVLDAMSNKYKTIEAFEASFTQKLTNEQAGLDESIEGEITVKENKFVLAVAGQKIFNDGENVFNFNPEIKEVTISPYIEEESEITLGNVYELYKDGFKYALISTLPNGDRVIELDPETRDKSYFKIRMNIGPKDDLKSFTVYERTGNIYLYKVDSFKEVDVNDSFFTFNPSDYPDVEVIDFR